MCRRTTRLAALPILCAPIRAEQPRCSQVRSVPPARFRQHYGYSRRNAICADVAAAFVAQGKPAANTPAVVDLESFIDAEHLDKVGFDSSTGKLGIVLANAVRGLAGPMIERAVDTLLERNGFCRSKIRFWIVHPGGRSVIDKVHRAKALAENAFARIRCRTDAAISGYF